MTTSASSARRFLFLVTSSRRDGNSEQLARCAAATLPATDSQTWLNLADLPLPAFVDLRHATSENWTPTIDGHARTLLEANGHRADEKLKLDDLYKATRVVALALAELLGEPAGENA